jgi:hypothetical protein
LDSAASPRLPHPPKARDAEAIHACQGVIPGLIGFHAGHLELRDRLVLLTEPIEIDIEV